MDVLKVIEKQIADIKIQESSGFLDQIYNHLQRADFYYQSGQSDDQYFNDVVYRTNQAFEGALKEAYKVLGGKTEKQTHSSTPFNIEKYFKENNIFKDRVLKLFENYRQEWRNTSTHDYQLILDENEAFLALVNVSSFVHLLLKQIQEKIAYNQAVDVQQDEKTQRNINELISKEGGSLIDKVRQLIRLFVTELEFNPEAKENEVLYMLIGFLTKSVPFDIQVEPKISVDYPNLRPDLIISDGIEKLVLELKRSKINTTKTILPQMASYLKLTKIRQALVFQFSAENIKKELNSKVHELSIGGQLYTVEILS